MSRIEKYGHDGKPYHGWSRDHFEYDGQCDLTERIRDAYDEIMRARHAKQESAEVVCTKA